MGRGVSHGGVEEVGRAFDVLCSVAALRDVKLGYVMGRTKDALGSSSFSRARRARGRCASSCRDGKGKSSGVCRTDLGCG